MECVEFTVKWIDKLSAAVVGRRDDQMMKTRAEKRHSRLGPTSDTEHEKGGVSERKKKKERRSCSGEKGEKDDRR